MSSELDLIIAAELRQRAKPRRRLANAVPKMPPRLATQGWREELGAWLLAIAVVGGLAFGWWAIA